MAKFALISDGKVQNLVTADSEDSIGPEALIYDVVEVTNFFPQPSVGWTLENDVFFPPKITDSVKALWNGSGFDEPKVKKTKAVKEKAAEE